jgi:hypothetical protein
MKGTPASRSKEITDQMTELKKQGYARPSELTYDKTERNAINNAVRDGRLSCVRFGYRLIFVPVLAAERILEQSRAKQAKKAERKAREAEIAAEKARQRKIDDVAANPAAGAGMESMIRAAVHDAIDAAVKPLYQRLAGLEVAVDSMKGQIGRVMEAADDIDDRMERMQVVASNGGRITFGGNGKGRGQVHA